MSSLNHGTFGRLIIVLVLSGACLSKMSVRVVLKQSKSASMLSQCTLAQSIKKAIQLYQLGEARTVISEERVIMKSKVRPDKWVGPETFCERRNVSGKEITRISGHVTILRTYTAANLNRLPTSNLTYGLVAFVLKATALMDERLQFLCYVGDIHKLVD